MVHGWTSFWQQKINSYFEYREKPRSVFIMDSFVANKKYVDSYFQWLFNGGIKSL